MEVKINSESLRELLDGERMGTIYLKKMIEIREIINNPKTTMTDMLLEIAKVIG